MSKLKTDDSQNLKQKQIFFKVILHHLKKGQSHTVGHGSFDLSEHVNPPLDNRNAPFEKLVSMKFQKCIDKNAKLYMYVHSMRVTDSGMNPQYDIDDNMSAYYSINSGGGLQSEYNYPESMCGSINGDTVSNQLVKKCRAMSPRADAIGHISP